MSNILVAEKLNQIEPVKSIFAKPILKKFFIAKSYTLNNKIKKIMSKPESGIVVCSFLIDFILSTVCNPRKGRAGI